MTKSQLNIIGFEFESSRGSDGNLVRVFLNADAMRREIKEGGERRILRLMRGNQVQKG